MIISGKINPKARFNHEQLLEIDSIKLVPFQIGMKALIGSIYKLTLCVFH
jgi:hypothetical protein